MRVLAILGMSISLVVQILAAPASAQDGPQERAAAADRYLTVVPMARMLDDTVREVAKQMPEERRQQFVDLMKSAMRVDVLERITRQALVEVFTTQELDALADFYGSRHGQSAMQKFGQYVGRIMPAVQQEVQSAFEEIKPRMQ